MHTLYRSLCMLLLASMPAIAAEAQPKKPSAISQGGVFAPRDEAAGDPSWTRFREQLLQALQARDKKFVLGIIAPAVIPSVILGLGLLVSVVQALVFTLLTTCYFAGAVEEAH